MKELQIAAAQELSELEGMGKSPCRIYIYPSGDIAIHDHLKFFDLELFPMDTPDDTIMIPWLKINDASEWSSAKILTRAGYIVIGAGWANKKIHWLWNAKSGDEAIQEEINVPEGFQELANIMGIIKLAEIDNEAYLKAMEPLR